jgi:hypothetical protein
MCIGLPIYAAKLVGPSTSEFFYGAPVQRCLLYELPSIYRRCFPRLFPPFFPASRRRWRGARARRRSGDLDGSSCSEVHARNEVHATSTLRPGPKFLPVQSRTPTRCLPGDYRCLAQVPPFHIHPGMLHCSSAWSCLLGSILIPNSWQFIPIGGYGLGRMLQHQLKRL